MAEPFLGEIRIMTYDFAPKGWALCDGQLLPINQNQALFSLLGTTFGGDGRTTFALPDLQARTPIHAGAGHILGEVGGEASHTLALAELPQHTHVLSGATSGNGTANPAGAFIGPANNLYHAPGGSSPMSPSSISTVGSGQPHENRQPYLTLTLCIALQGIFPSRN